LKILIVGSPKTGNVWVERLLATIYGLPIVDMSGTSLLEIPPPRLAVPRFVAHQHYGCTPEILDWGRAEGVSFVTAVRHPGDAFVSLFHYVNEFAAANAANGLEMPESERAIVGKAIDSPEILEYLEVHFLPGVMQLSFDWLMSGASIVVRYEELRTSGAEALRGLTRRLKPVFTETIDRALKANSIDRVRRLDPFLKLHCRDGSSGQWRRELTDAHREIFRRQWSGQLAKLGYSFD